MQSWLRNLRAVAVVAVLSPLAFAALHLTVTVAFDSAAVAQTRGEVPGAAVGGRSDSEQWRAIRRGTRGAVSIPNKRSGVMIQSEGESWRAIRNGPVSVYGLWVLGGMLVLLLAFFLIRGRIRIESGFSGRVIERFNGLDRFAHWLTATSFCVLGLTGLNMLYGRYFIKPMIGADAFSTLTGLGKYAHNYIAFAFMVGIIMILVLWVRDNIPERIDIEWLAKGGGMFSSGVHPPARKFNAGQKILFWLVVLSGISISFTGIGLLFPFTIEVFGGTFAALNLIGFDLPTDLSPMAEMQLTQLWHVILSLVMIAVILAHIYIGWLGMEGAYDAMGNGYVDENWAQEHHPLWVEDNKYDAGKEAGTPRASD